MSPDHRRQKGRRLLAAGSGLGVRSDSMRLCILVIWAVALAKKLVRK